MYSYDYKFTKIKSVIDELIETANDGTPLVFIGDEDNPIDLLRFAIKEYTNSRFYYPINKILNDENFLSLPSYLCCIIKNLPKN